MAQVLKDQRAWFHGNDLTGVMNAIALEYSADAKENTVFGNSTHTNQGGLMTVAASLEGFFDAAKDKIIYDNVGASDKVFSFGASSNAGDAAYSFLAMVGSYIPGGTVGELFSFSLEAAAAGKLIRGVIAENRTGQAATGNGTGRQLSAVAQGKKLYAALHVLNVAGVAPTLDLVIRSDDAAGFATPVTQITFDQVTAIGSQWKEVAGPITDTYYRPSFTIGGAGATFDFVLILAIQ